MFRRLARAASSAAKAHLHGLNAGPACPAASRARRLLVPPSPALDPAARMPASTGVPGSISAGATAAYSVSAPRCVANASRWLCSSVPGGGNVPALNEQEKKEDPSPNAHTSPKESEEDSPTNQPEKGVQREATLEIPLHATDINLSLSALKYMRPDEYFKKRPILREQDLGLVTELAGRSKLLVADDTRETFFSLFELMVVNHMDLIAIGDALKEGKLLISWETGKFKLTSCKALCLLPEREKEDCTELHDLVVRFVEAQLGEGGKDKLPADLKDLLEKLKEDCVQMKLILLHPCPSS